MSPPSCACEVMSCKYCWHSSICPLEKDLFMNLPWTCKYIPGHWCDFRFLYSITAAWCIKPHPILQYHPTVPPIVAESTISLHKIGKYIYDGSRTSGQFCCKKQDVRKIWQHKDGGNTGLVDRGAGAVLKGTVSRDILIYYFVLITKSELFVKPVIFIFL